MLLRTHIAIAVLAVLLFIPHIAGGFSKFVFVSVALIACLMPDIDTMHSSVGKFKLFRIFQFFIKHRGIFHSFTFCIFISLIFSFFIPILALPFFLGYSLHLFGDSFTQEGIMPFWPLRKRAEWHLRTGSLIETNLFLTFVILDLILLMVMTKGFF